MNLTLDQQKDLAALPPALRALLDAELAAGNELVEVGHGFPAAPCGAWFKLAQPLLAHARAASGGIDYYDRDMPEYSGEITDGQRHFFILEPPHPPRPEPDMDAIRSAAQAPLPVVPAVACPTVTPQRLSGAGAGTQKARPAGAPASAPIAAAARQGQQWDPLESTCRHASLSIL